MSNYPKPHVVEVIAQGHSKLLNKIINVGVGGVPPCFSYLSVLFLDIPLYIYVPIYTIYTIYISIILIVLENRGIEVK